MQHSFLFLIITTIISVTKACFLSMFDIIESLSEEQLQLLIKYSKYGNKVKMSKSDCADHRDIRDAISKFKNQYQSVDLFLKGNGNNSKDVMQIIVFLSLLLHLQLFNIFSRLALLFCSDVYPLHIHSWTLLAQFYITSHQ